MQYRRSHRKAAQEEAVYACGGVQEDKSDMGPVFWIIINRHTRVQSILLLKFWRKSYLQESALFVLRCGMFGDHVACRNCEYQFADTFAIMKRIEGLLCKCACQRGNRLLVSL